MHTCSVHKTYPFGVCVCVQLRAFCGTVKGLVDACAILSRLENEDPPLRASLLLPPGDGRRGEAMEVLSECFDAIVWPRNAKERPRISVEEEVGGGGFLSVFANLFGVDISNFRLPLPPFACLCLLSAYFLPTFAYFCLRLHTFAYFCLTPAKR